MKTRIVYPRLWLDEKFATCALPTKLLFCYLINNPHLGLSPYLHITDRQIMFDTGLSASQLQTGKLELTELRWCFFAENWVYHHHSAAYIDYDGRDRVLASKDEEINAVPTPIKEVFKGLIRGLENAVTEPKVKGLITPYKPVLNKKPETINPKEGGVGETKPERSKSYLTNIPPDHVTALAQEHNLSGQAIRRKGKDLLDWCDSTGKVKKDYRAFLRIAISRDADDLRKRFGSYIPDTSQFIDPFIGEMIGIRGGL